MRRGRGGGVWPPGGCEGDVGVQPAAGGSHSHGGGGEEEGRVRGRADDLHCLQHYCLVPTTLLPTSLLATSDIVLIGWHVSRCRHASLAHCCMDRVQVAFYVYHGAGTCIPLK